MFQATLYFEDQSGWTDSIRIGYDTSANNLFNPEFGEFNIGQSFDPVFEVRASHRNAAPLAEEGAILSKTIIGHAELEVMAAVALAMVVHHATPKASIARIVSA